MQFFIQFFVLLILVVAWCSGCGGDGNRSSRRSNSGGEHRTSTSTASVGGEHRTSTASGGGEHRTSTSTVGTSIGIAGLTGNVRNLSIPFRQSALPSHDETTYGWTATTVASQSTNTGKPDKKNKKKNPGKQKE
ncbi:hypothetical protein GPALN_014549 [Globodera pallida]|nr:hypothetical protein GPALN_014549 [Globodera pallida]